MIINCQTGMVFCKHHGFYQATNHVGLCLLQSNVCVGIERNTNGIIIVRPDSFADAIAAPALIHSRRAPIIIPATTTDLGEANIEWLTENAARLDTVTVLGETDVVPDAIVAQAVDAICAARDCKAQ